MFDLLLKNGVIIDGLGTQGHQGDVAIKNGYIEKVGVIKKAVETIDISELAVAPGFIDTHSHSDLFLIHEPHSLPKIMQGITTEIVGQDGLGEAPIRKEDVQGWRRYLSGLNGDPPIEWSWRSYKEYLDVLENSGTAVNVAGLVGHGNLRLLAMGMDDRGPSDSEVNEMKRLLRECLEAGAIGMSTGLIYAPCVYAETDELVELCKVVAEYSSVFVVHMRDEGDQLLESIDEILTIGEKSGVHCHISHFKASGEKNWGKSKEALELLEEGVNQGIKISYDQYPYIAGSTFLSSLLPSWVHEGGVERLLARLRDSEIREKIRSEYSEGVESGRNAGWDKVLVTYVESPKNRGGEGKTLEEIAELREQSPVDALMDIVLEENNMASMANFTMSEEDVKRIMKHPFGMVCTDGLLLGKPHPRAFGAFPRVLGHYVREEGVLDLEMAVKRMTSYPCNVFGLDGRGVVKPGYVADLVVFDPAKVIDKSTYREPRLHPEGIVHVIVNGELVVKHGEYTGMGNGKIIKAG